MNMEEKNFELEVAIGNGNVEKLQKLLESDENKSLFVDAYYYATANPNGKNHGEIMEFLLKKLDTM